MVWYRVNLLKNRAHGVKNAVAGHCVVSVGPSLVWPLCVSICDFYTICGALWGRVVHSGVQGARQQSV